MWRAWGLACGLLAASVGAIVAEGKEKDIDRWALLIGVDDIAELERLECVTAVRRAFAERLAACGFNRDHVFRLKSKEKRANHFPAKLNVERQFDLVPWLAARDEVVVLGFISDVVEVDSASYRCPLEARRDNLQTMIALDEVYKRLQSCRADLKLALIDACPNQDHWPARARAPGVSWSVAGLSKSAEGPRRDLIMLSSCDFRQQAREDEKEPMAPAPIKPVEISTNSIGMKLVAIPAGEFMMGSPEGEEGRYKDELLHRVRITRGFEMGIYEVTVGEFRKFVAATNYRTDAETDGKGGWGWTGEGSFPFRQKPSFNWRNWWSNQRETSPVVNVSWNDATAFCRWLSQQEGATYRLPTEAEWEYACRAGTSTRFYGGEGEESLEATANIADASVKRIASFFSRAKPWDDKFSLTAPVGQFRANAFGLYDMHGNALEWCQDWYGRDYYAESSADDPQGPSAGTTHSIRGGGWNYYPTFCRSASRPHFEPAYRNDNFGFRVVRGR